MWVPEEKKGLKYTEPESVCGKIFQLLYERNDQNLSKFDKNLKNVLDMTELRS